jgi:serine/threonine protein kinase
VVANKIIELSMCVSNRHPAIPRLEEFFFDTSGRVEIVMELMEGGELFNYIVESQHLSEGKARTVFRQIVAGVAHLHSIGIAHRDLKPQNLMYCRISDSNRELGQIKIIDYDLARVNHSPQWEGSTPCGTMYYMAPEVVHGQVYSLGIDCWSLGVILYILLSGELPFQGPDEKHIAALIRNGKYSLEGSAWEHVSQNAKFLVKGLLEVNPNHRLTAVQCLQHPWLQELTQDSIADLVEAARDSTAGERPQMTSIPDGKLKTIENLKRLSLTREASGSLTKALDYDLEALRHEEPPGKPLTGSVDAKDIARLKVTLDLVGRHAGLQDSWTNSPSKGGSPVYSPSKCRLSRDSKDPWQHEFDDLGASVTFVEEETDVISPKVPR